MASYGTTTKGSFGIRFFKPGKLLFPTIVLLILLIDGFSENFSLQPAAFSNSDSSYCCGYFPPATPFISLTVIEGQLAAKAVVLKPATRKETTTIFINIFFIFTSVN